MKLALSILCLLAIACALCSCTALYAAWGHAYRQQGGYYEEHRR
jgi:hypothetical protein